MGAGDGEHLLRRSPVSAPEPRSPSHRSWIKQGTDSLAPARAPAPAPPLSPLAERPPLGQVAAPPMSPAVHARPCGAGAGVGFFSPKGLPPVRVNGKRHSGLLGRHSVLLSAADSDEWEDESVASWGMPEDCYGGGNFSDTADEVCSSDSSLTRRAMDRCGGGWDEEVTSQMSRKEGEIVRGQSKKFLLGYAPVLGHKIQWTTSCSRRHGFSSVARRR